MKEGNQEFIDNLNWCQNTLKVFKDRKKQNIENRAAFKKHVTFFKSYLKDPNRNLNGNEIGEHPIFRIYPESNIPFAAFVDNFIASIRSSIISFVNPG